MYRPHTTLFLYTANVVHTGWMRARKVKLDKHFASNLVTSAHTYMKMEQTYHHFASLS